MLVPKQVFFTKGVGIHKKELQSFELALRDAGIEKQNIVTVSSIFPPHCKTISKENGLKLLQPGQVTFCVMSRCNSNEHGRLIASSVGCAIPTDRNAYGYLSEHHVFGQNDTVAGNYAEDLAAVMLASTLGLDVSEDLKWDERKEMYKLCGKIVRTSNITQSAVCKGNGLYTTVIAVAVFIL